MKRGLASPSYNRLLRGSRSNKATPALPQMSPLKLPMLSSRSESLLEDGEAQPRSFLWPRVGVDILVVDSLNGLENAMVIRIFSLRHSGEWRSIFAGLE